MTMLMILFAILAAAALSGGMMYYSAFRRFDSIFLGLAGGILALLTGVTALTYVYSAWSWFAADHRAQILNREYGTNYTQSEVYWASDVIDMMRELDRKRVEINGDLITGHDRSEPK